MHGLEMVVLCLMRTPHSSTAVVREIECCIAGEDVRCIKKFGVASKRLNSFDTKFSLH